MKYCYELIGHKEVNKTERCLHLQSADGNSCECINVLMAPLTGHK